MIMNSRVFVSAVIGAVMVAAAVGCSSNATSTSSSAPSMSSSATSTAQARPAGPSATASPDLSTDSIKASVTAEGINTVRPGGPPLRFTIKLINNGPDIDQVGMVVSLSHCSCAPSPGPMMMPAGTMRMLDPNTNAWVDVPYVAEGTGMDYLGQNLVPPFPLNHGQSATYQLEMALNADQNYPVGKGDASIGVTLTHPDNPLGPRIKGSASLPLTVEPQAG